MAQEAQEFMRGLQQTIDGKRTFGRHPLWLKIAAGKLSRPQVQTWAAQFFLQVREFPRAVSGLHTSCPFLDERIKLAESLYEEETGRISGCNVPHPSSSSASARASASRGASFSKRSLSPARRRSFICSSRRRVTTRSWKAPQRSTSAAEGQVPGAFAPFARALEKHYGLTREQVAFWDIHEEADREHSDVGDHIVARYATTDELQEKIARSLTRSLDTWWQFFDDIERRVS
jgi:pyrroloquinoline-quinone synthase